MASHVNKSVPGSQALKVFLEIPKKENQFLVEQLKEGDTFKIKGNRIFVRGTKIRTRFKCMELATKKWYLFSGLYEVVKL